MITITDMFDAQAHYKRIAKLIIRIYSNERAIDGYDHYYSYNHKMPDFSLDGFTLSQDRGEVAINAYCYMGDQRDYTCITTPVDWFDNFDETVVTEGAKSAFAARMQSIEAEKMSAIERAKASELQILQDLLKKHPEAAAALT